MTSTYTTNKNIEKPAYNDYSTNSTGWTSPVNTDWDIIDRALGGAQVLNPTSVSGVVNLTTSQYQAPILIVGTSISGTATLTANVTYQIPSSVGGIWTVYNNTTGSFTITISSGGGGGSVLVPQGNIISIYSDGTNIRSITIPSPIPAGTVMPFYQAAAPTGWTQVTSVNDSTIRIVNGSGGNTTGSVGFYTYFSGSYATGATTLTIDQIPNHNHDINDSGHAHRVTTGGVAGGNYTPLNNGFGGYNTTEVAYTGISIQYTGGGNSHTHTVPSGLKYSDVIICSKD